jgi:hypothetical protein
MYKKFSALGKLLSLLAIGGLVVAALPSGAWAADESNDHAKEWAQHRQEWVRAKLDREANRLEIKASQETAWQTYANARMALAERTFSEPAENADAGAIAKNRAERAAEIARKLASLADATTKLQVALSPEQRKTLDQVVRHGRHRYGHQAWRHRHDGSRGEGHERSSESQIEQAPAT